MEKEITDLRMTVTLKRNRNLKEQIPKRNNRADSNQHSFGKRHSRVGRRYLSRCILHVYVEDIDARWMRRIKGSKGSELWITNNKKGNKYLGGVQPHPGRLIVDGRQRENFAQVILSLLQSGVPT